MATPNKELEYIESFIKLQQDLEPIKKDAINPHFKNHYATLGGIREAILKKLGENGFALIQGCTEDNRSLKTRLIHKNGQEVTTYYPLIETSDPQKMAGAVTYASRNAIGALFGLVTTEDDDGNTASTADAIKNKPYPGEATTKSDTGLEKARFVPKWAGQKEGKSGKLSYSVLDQDGNFYSSLNEKDGEIFYRAKSEGKPIVMVYKMNGRFRNCEKVYIDEVKVSPDGDATIEDVGF